MGVFVACCAAPRAQILSRRFGPAPPSPQVRAAVEKHLPNAASLITKRAEAVRFKADNQELIKQDLANETVTFAALWQEAAGLVERELRYWQVRTGEESARERDRERERERAAQRGMWRVWGRADRTASERARGLCD